MEPLFAFERDRSPCGRITQLLSRFLGDTGFVSANFSDHSFRHGAATQAASVGLSAEKTMILGRWSSDWFKL